MARILVMDDDYEIRLVLRRMLEAAGHEVEEAVDGEEGLRYYRIKPADLVITDILMPGGDGLSTIREIRREFPDARIIAMSGGDMSADVGFLPRAEELGAVRTVAKPFDLAQMREAVDEVLKGNS